MLPSENRLKKGRAIQEILKRGRWVNDSYFTVKFTGTESNPATPTRAAIVISKTIEKKAVYRNRMKRRIAECVQELLKEYRLPCPIIIIPKATATSLDFKAIQKSIHSLLKPLLRPNER